MRVKRLVVGMFQCNCYLVWDEAGEGVVIDPGGGGDLIVETIAAERIAVRAVIYTHGHRDHTWAGREVRKATGAPLYRHPDEISGMMFSSRKITNHTSVFDLADRQELNFGALRFSVIHTPGHSPGSVCLYREGGADEREDRHVLFAGDLLFQGNIGRFDLKGGSFRELIRSLEQRLAHLPDDTRVLPGHGPATTLGEERISNPAFRLARDFKRGKKAKNET